jgi:FkbM family methyltransferase
MIIKRAGRHLIERAGYRVYAPQTFPIGFNWLLDVERLAGSREAIKTIFDVGANVGQTALLLSNRFPKARIYSFEPLAGTFEQLSQNVGKLANIVCEHCALGEETKTVDLYPKAESQWNTLVTEFNVAAGQQAETIQVIKADEFIVRKSLSRIDLLKTDTEGFDLEVMKGASAALKECRIGIILSEVGFHPERRHHTYLPDLQAYLAQHDYELYCIYDQNQHDGRIDYADALFVSAPTRRACDRAYADTVIRNAS